MKRPDEDRRWRDALAGLPRSIAPRNDPWPGLSARIAGAASGDRRQLSRFRWPVAAAAAVVLAAAALLTIRQQAVDVGAPGQGVSANTAQVPGVTGSLRETEREYRAALREFEALAGGAALPDSTLAPSWRGGLIVLEETERELKAALRNEPDNPYIIERLVQLHARQVDMLRQFVSAGQASGRRTI